MRYIVHSDSEPYNLSLKFHGMMNENVYKFTYQSNENERELFVRRAPFGDYFSLDMKAWRPLVNLPCIEQLTFINQTFKAYRGYLPSGLSQASEGSLVSQMPGKVVKIMVDVNQKIKVGQTLLVIEAMKMENEIKANVDGTVKEIYVSPGQAIDSGVPLIEIE